MRNSFEEKYKFINDNNLNATGFAFDYLDDKDLAQEGLIEKMLEIEKRYEGNGCRYPEYMMCQLRQRLGLEDKYDTQYDEEINNMSSDKVFEHLLNWNGLVGWDYKIKDWVKMIYGVELNNEMRKGE